MTIKQFAVSDAAADVLREAIGKRHPAAVTRGPLAPEIARRGGAIPCFYLPLDVLDKDSPLQFAEHTGWRFIVEPDAGIALAKVGNEVGGARPQFQGLSRGLLVQRLEQALAFADRYLGADQAEFEPRLLDIPGIDYSALWLTGTRDCFIPLLDGRPPGTAPLVIMDDIFPELQRRMEGRTRADPLRAARGTPTN